MMQQQIMQNVVKSPRTDLEIRNPNEKTEQLLEKANEKYDKQIELLEKSNVELQLKLDKSNFELKQLNDKVSSQTYYIKELKVDLKEETERRIKAEDKLSSKDWKLSLISFAVGVGSGLLVAWITWLIFY